MPGAVRLVLEVADQVACKTGMWWVLPCGGFVWIVVLGRVPFSIWVCVTVCLLYAL